MSSNSSATDPEAGQLHDFNADTMSSKPRILCFAGSTRAASFNVRLVRAAARVAEANGAEVEVLDLAEYDMPIFGEDLEAEGTPDAARAFKEKLKSADGFLISTPEYNSSYPALLKNAIDWASRPAEGEAMLAAFKGKACGLFAASPGGLGGIRVLPQLRTLMMNIGVRVVPTQFGLANAHEAFDEDGELTNERARTMVEAVVKETLVVAGL